MKLRKLVEGLSIEKLRWRYRPDGWMIKQVVHHCADSHMNGLIRFKLTLTENLPEIKPYHEAKWAELADSNYTFNGFIRCFTLQIGETPQ